MDYEAALDCLQQLTVICVMLYSRGANLLAADCFCEWMMFGILGILEKYINVRALRGAVMAAAPLMLAAGR